jgi:hypothetical protein
MTDSKIEVLVGDPDCVSDPDLEMMMEAGTMKCLVCGSVLRKADRPLWVIFQMGDNANP